MPATIRIKRSGTTLAPSSLKVGELAYSYATDSKKLYIGIGPEVDENGTAASIAVIGGEFFTDLINGIPGISVANRALILGADRNTDYLKIESLHVDSATFADISIDSAYIQFAGIDSAYIHDLVVDSAYIQFADIDSAHIDNLTVDSAYIRYLDVDSGHFDNVTIDSAQIKFMDVDSGHVDNLTVDSAYIKNADILFATLTEVDSAYIHNASIDSAYIKYASVDSADISLLRSDSAYLTKATIATSYQPLITGPEQIVIDPSGIGDNTGRVLIKGDLQVDGTQTIINSTTVSTNDRNILIADSAVDSAAADGAGITVYGDGDYGRASLFYDATLNKWRTSIGLKVPSIDADSARILQISGTNLLYDAATIQNGNVSQLTSDSASITTLTGTFLTYNNGTFKVSFHDSALVNTALEQGIFFAGANGALDTHANLKFDNQTDMLIGRFTKPGESRYGLHLGHREIVVPGGVDSGYYHFSVTDSGDISAETLKIGDYLRKGFQPHFSRTKTNPHSFYGIQVDSAEFTSTLQRNFFKSDISKADATTLDTTNDSINILTVKDNSGADLIQLRKDGSINFTGSLLFENEPFSGGGIFDKKKLGITGTPDTGNQIYQPDQTKRTAFGGGNYLALNFDRTKPSFDPAHDFDMRGDLTTFSVSGALLETSLVSSLLPDTTANSLAGSPFYVKVDDSDKSRMFFDTAKARFRAGYFVRSSFTETEMGSFSAAFGKNSKAAGDYSFAFGDSTETRSANSFVGGEKSTIDQGLGSSLSVNAVAIGKENVILNSASAIALGEGNLIGTTSVYGTDGVALGRDNKIQGDGVHSINSVAIGKNNFIKSTITTVIGKDNTTENTAANSFVIGQNNNVKSGRSYIIGDGHNDLATSSSARNYAFGEYSTFNATTTQSMAIGRYVKIGNSVSGAIGINLGIGSTDPENENYFLPIQDDNLMSIQNGNLSLGTDSDITAAGITSGQGNLYIKGSIIYDGDIFKRVAGGVITASPWIDDGTQITYNNGGKNIGAHVTIPNSKFELFGEMMVRGAYNGAYKDLPDLFDSIGSGSSFGQAIPSSQKISLFTYYPQGGILRAGNIKVHNTNTNDSMGAHSIGIGNENFVLGDYGLVIGGRQGEVYSNYGAVIGGRQGTVGIPGVNANPALGEYAMSIGGYGNEVRGKHSIAIGGQAGNRIHGDNNVSIAAGTTKNNISGSKSVFIGYSNTDSHQGSFPGYNSNSGTQENNYWIGYDNRVDSTSSNVKQNFIFGHSNLIKTKNSGATNVIIGHTNDMGNTTGTSTAKNNFVFGQNNKITGSAQKNVIIGSGVEISSTSNNEIILYAGDSEGIHNTKVSIGYKTGQTNWNRRGVLQTEKFALDVNGNVRFGRDDSDNSTTLGSSIIIVNGQDIRDYVQRIDPNDTPVVIETPSTSLADVLSTQASAPTSAPTPIVTAGLTITTNASGTIDLVSMTPGTSPIPTLDLGGTNSFNASTLTALKTALDGSSSLSSAGVVTSIEEKSNAVSAVAGGTTVSTIGSQDTITIVDRSTATISLTLTDGSGTVISTTASSATATEAEAAIDQANQLILNTDFGASGMKTRAVGNDVLIERGVLKIDRGQVSTPEGVLPAATVVNIKQENPGILIIRNTPTGILTNGTTVEFSLPSLTAIGQFLSDSIYALRPVSTVGDSFEIFNSTNTVGVDLTKGATRDKGGTALVLGADDYDSSDFGPVGSGTIPFSQYVSLKELPIVTSGAPSIFPRTVLMDSDLIVKGSGSFADSMTIGNDAVIKGNLKVPLGSITTGGSLTVEQPSVFLSDLSIGGGALTISKSQTVGEAGVTLTGGIDILGHLSVSDSVSIGTALSVTGAATFADSVRFGGSIRWLDNAYTDSFYIGNMTFDSYVLRPGSQVFNAIVDHFDTDYVQQRVDSFNSWMIHPDALVYNPIITATGRKTVAVGRSNNETWTGWQPSLGTTSNLYMTGMTPDYTDDDATITSAAYAGRGNFGGGTGDSIGIDVMGRINIRSNPGLDDHKTLPPILANGEGWPNATWLRQNNYIDQPYIRSKISGQFLLNTFTEDASTASNAKAFFRNMLDSAYIISVWDSDYYWKHDSFNAVYIGVPGQLYDGTSARGSYYDGNLKVAINKYGRDATHNLDVKGTAQVSSTVDLRSKLNVDSDVKMEASLMIGSFNGHNDGVDGASQLITANRGLYVGDSTHLRDGLLVLGHANVLDSTFTFTLDSHYFEYRQDANNNPTLNNSQIATQYNLDNPDDSHVVLTFTDSPDFDRLRVIRTTGSTLPNVTYAVSVVNSGSGNQYSFNGGEFSNAEKPVLNLKEGGTYTFNLNVSGHPFYFTVDDGSNHASGSYVGEYTTGITGSRAETGTLVFTVPEGAPQLYYNCAYHVGMQGTANTPAFTTSASSILVKGTDWDSLGNRTLFDSAIYGFGRPRHDLMNDTDRLKKVYIHETSLDASDDSVSVFWFDNELDSASIHQDNTSRRSIIVGPLKTTTSGIIGFDSQSISDAGDILAINAGKAIHGVTDPIINLRDASGNFKGRLKHHRDFTIVANDQVRIFGNLEIIPGNYPEYWDATESASIIMGDKIEIQDRSNKIISQTDLFGETNLYGKVTFGTPEMANAVRPGYPHVGASLTTYDSFVVKGGFLVESAPGGTKIEFKSDIHVDSDKTFFFGAKKNVTSIVSAINEFVFESDRTLSTPSNLTSKVESDGSYIGTITGVKHRHSDSAGGTDGRGHVIGHVGTTGVSVINQEVVRTLQHPVTMDSHIARFLSAETDHITLSTPLLTTNDISVSPGSTWYYGNARTRPFSYPKFDSDGVGNRLLHVSGSNIGQPKLESDGTFDGTLGPWTDTTDATTIANTADSANSSRRRYITGDSSYQVSLDSHVVDILQNPPLEKLVFNRTTDFTEKVQIINNLHVDSSYKLTVSTPTYFYKYESDGTGSGNLTTWPAGQVGSNAYPANQPFLRDQKLQRFNFQTFVSTASDAQNIAYKIESDGSPIYPSKPNADPTPTGILHYEYNADGSQKIHKVSLDSHIVRIIDSDFIGSRLNDPWKLKTASEGTTPRIYSEQGAAIIVGPSTLIPATDTRTKFIIDSGNAIFLSSPTQMSDSQNDITHDVVPSYGTRARMMWIPTRGAFRVGQLDLLGNDKNWDDSNVGIHSIGIGSNTYASHYSTAIGYNTQAGQTRDSATDPLHSDRMYSVSVGQDIVNREHNSVAIGTFIVHNTGDAIYPGKSGSPREDLLSIGKTIHNKANKAVAIGFDLEIAGEAEGAKNAENSLAIGREIDIKQDAKYSIAIGKNLNFTNTNSSSTNNTAFGRDITFSGSTNTNNNSAFGRDITFSSSGTKTNTTVLGRNISVQGNQNTMFALGDDITISNQSSSSSFFGRKIVSSGNSPSAFAIGDNVRLTSRNSSAFVMGKNITLSNTGSGSVSFGQNIYMSGSSTGLALGTNIDVSKSGTAIGKSVSAGSGVAIGRNVSSTHYSSHTGVAIGHNVKGLQGAVAIGQTIPSAAKFSVAIGHSLTSVGQQSVNIGARNSTAKFGIALGSRNFASGSRGSVAVGENARSIGSNGFSVALGRNVTSGKNGVSIGAENVGSTQSIIIGANNNSTGSSSSARSVIVGYNNQVNGQNTSQITVGISNRSNTRVNVFGQNNTNNQNVTIFGSGNTNSSAPTSGSSANNINESIIFGFANKITSRSGLAYGKNNIVSSAAIAYGDDNTVAAEGIAFGRDNNVNNSTGGSFSQASFAYGRDNTANTLGMAFGRNNTVSTSGIAFGRDNDAQQNAIAIGRSSTAYGAEALAIGYNVTVGSSSNTATKSIGIAAGVGPNTVSTDNTIALRGQVTVNQDVINTIPGTATLTKHVPGTNVGVPVTTSNGAFGISGTIGTDQIGTTIALEVEGAVNVRGDKGEYFMQGMRMYDYIRDIAADALYVLDIADSNYVKTVVTKEYLRETGTSDQFFQSEGTGASDNIVYTGGGNVAIGGTNPSRSRYADAASKDNINYKVDVVGNLNLDGLTYQGDVILPIGPYDSSIYLNHYRNFTNYVISPDSASAKGFFDSAYVHARGNFGMNPSNTYDSDQIFRLINGQYIDENITPLWLTEDEIIQKVDSAVTDAHIAFQPELVLGAETGSGHTNSKYKVSAYGFNASERLGQIQYTNPIPGFESLVQTKVGIGKLAYTSKDANGTTISGAVAGNDAVRSLTGQFGYENSGLSLAGKLQIHGPSDPDAPLLPSKAALQIYNGHIEIDGTPLDLSKTFEVGTSFTTYNQPTKFIGIGNSSPQHHVDIAGRLNADSGLFIAGVNIFDTLDSDFIISVIDSDYVKQFIDSAYIQSNIANVNTNVIPTTDIAFDLGSPTKRFKDLFLSGQSIHIGNTILTSDTNGLVAKDSGGNVLRFVGVDSNAVTSFVNRDYVQSRADSAYIFSIADSGYIRSVADSAYIQDIADSAYILTAVDSAYIKGIADSAYILTAADSAYILSQLLATGHILPALDSAYDIGSSTHKFKDLYLSGNTINLGGARISSTPGGVKIADNSGAQLKVFGVDSDATTHLIDSAYVRARADSAYVTGMIDSAYLSVFIDSAYVAARTPPVSIEASMITPIVDSAYVAARTRIGSDDINFGLNKILYNNTYTTNTLPSAVDYKGMFVFDATVNRAKVGAGGSWMELARSVDVRAIADSAAAALVNGAPAVLDTLNELATALGNDSAFSTTVANSLTLKLNVADIPTNIDSAYVLARSPEFDFVTNIDSAYVRARQSGIDSAAIIGMVDSAYIIARSAAGTDSNAVMTLIDSHLNLHTATTNQVLSYDGSDYAWVAQSSGGGGGSLDSSLIEGMIDSSYVTQRMNTGFDLFTFNATANQTVFSGNDTFNRTVSFVPMNNSPMVYLNGALMRQNVDYTSQDSTGITFLSGVDSSDEVTIMGFKHASGTVVYNTSDRVVYTRPRFVNHRFDADSGQTTFSGTDVNGVTLDFDADKVQVFNNGIRLVSGLDYNASSNSVTTTYGLDSGDDLVINALVYSNTLFETSSLDSSDIVTIAKSGIDSAYIQSITSAGTDSAAIVDLIDSAYIAARSGGGLKISVNAPLNPVAGSMWFDPEVLETYVYYVDSNGTAQWVKSNPSGPELALTQVSNIVDSAYVSARVSAGTDSASIINMIDSAYVSARVSTPNTWSEVTTTPVTAVANQRLILDTSGGVKVVNLPSTATLGDEIRIIDGTGNASTNNITINRNGHKIEGSDSDLTIDVNRAAFGLVYYNVANGWLFTEK